MDYGSKPLFFEFLSLLALLILKLSDILYFSSYLCQSIDHFQVQEWKVSVLTC